MNEYDYRFIFINFGSAPAVFAFEIIYNIDSDAHIHPQTLGCGDIEAIFLFSAWIGKMCWEAK